MYFLSSLKSISIYENETQFTFTLKTVQQTCETIDDKVHKLSIVYVSHLEIARSVWQISNLFTKIGKFANLSKFVIGHANFLTRQVNDLIISVPSLNRKLPQNIVPVSAR